MSSYLKLIGEMKTESYIPNEVMGLCVKKGLSLLAAWRTHKGLSQTQLGEAVGVSQSAIAQLEKVGARPRKPTLEKIASVLGISVDQIVE